MLNLSEDCPIRARGLECGWCDNYDAKKFRPKCQRCNNRTPVGTSQTLCAQCAEKFVEDVKTMGEQMIKPLKRKSILLDQNITRRCNYGWRHVTMWELVFLCPLYFAAGWWLAKKFYGVE